jgi:hypothetical protein
MGTGGMQTCFTFLGGRMRAFASGISLRIGCFWLLWIRIR